MPITICFLNYTFNELIHMSCFHKCFPNYTFSYDRHKNLRKSLLWVLRKKETFDCAIFDKTCYVACTINCACKLICLSAWLHEHNHTSLIDKSAWVWCSLLSICVEDPTILIMVRQISIWKLGQTSEFPH